MKEIDLIKTMSQELETLGEIDTTEVVLQSRLLACSRYRPFCIVVSSEAYSNLLGQQWFIRKFELSAKHQVVLEGVMGHLWEIPLLSDAFQHPDVRAKLPPLANNMLYLGRLHWKE